MVLELKKSPTLQDFQSYVRQMKQERGFNTTDKFYECCLFAEEAGEVISAVRKMQRAVRSAAVQPSAMLQRSLPTYSFMSVRWQICTALIWNRLFAIKKKKTSCAPGNGYRQQSGLLRVRDCFNPNCLGCGTVFEYVRDGVRRGGYGSTFCRSQSRISLNRRAEAAELRRSAVIFCAATILAREISGFCR